MARTLTEDAKTREGGWRLHGIFWVLLAIGGTIGLALWGKWGLLVAFDTIRAYCF